MATETKGRIYCVAEHDTTGKVITEKLVRAGTAASAIRHVVVGRYSAEAASASEVARLMGAGVTVQEAGAE